MPARILRYHEPMKPPIKKEGRQISYGIFTTTLGDCLIASTGGRVCEAGFISPKKRDEAVEQLKRRWKLFEVTEDLKATRDAAKAIDKGSRAPVLASGTTFQRQVWRELTRLKKGETITYGELAARIGRPTAVRAVATAVSRNPVAVLIPCHRVIRGDGQIGGYRWGAKLKKALLVREKGQ